LAECLEDLPAEGRFSGMRGMFFSRVGPLDCWPGRGTLEAASWALPGAGEVAGVAKLCGCEAGVEVVPEVTEATAGEGEDACARATTGARKAMAVRAVRPAIGRMRLFIGTMERRY
jgi:hypothetical protein